MESEILTNSAAGDSSDSESDAVLVNRWTKSIKNSSEHSKHEAEACWNNGNKATASISLFY